MSDDVKVTFSADTSSVATAITKINGAGGGGSGGGGGGGGGGPTLPPPSGPLGPFRRRRKGDWRDGAIDVETVPDKGGKPPTPPFPNSSIEDDGFRRSRWPSGIEALRAIGGFLEESIDYAVKVKQASLRTGVSVEGIQKFTNAAKQQGLEFEDAAAILIEGNKKLGESMIRGGGVQMGLNRLGVSIEQIKNKSVSVTEVMMKLADMYQQTGDQVRMAQLGTQVFGESFTKMIPLLKQGREAITAMGDASIVMSKQEIDSAAENKRTIEVAKKLSISAGTSLAGTLSEIFVRATKVNYLADENNPLSEDMRYSKSDVKAAKMYLGSFIQEGETVEEFYKREIEQYKKDKSTGRGMPGIGMTDKQRVEEFDKYNIFRTQVINGLAEMVDRINKRPKMPGFQDNMLANASTLQQMGGGDVLTAISRTPMQVVQDNTQRTAEAVERIDNKFIQKRPGTPTTTLRPPL
jgi:hypothetical protein